jgi:hypothetical protein
VLPFVILAAVPFFLLCLPSATVRCCSRLRRCAEQQLPPPTPTPPSLAHGHLGFKLCTTGEESSSHRLPPVHGAGRQVQEQERQLLLQVLK